MTILFHAINASYLLCEHVMKRRHTSSDSDVQTVKPLIICISNL